MRRKFPAAATGVSHADSGEGRELNMGSGVCSRRQRRIVQSLLLLSVVCGMLYGGMVSYEMHQQLKRTETVALKYQQHQESLSAQLQGRWGELRGVCRRVARTSRRTPVAKLKICVVTLIVKPQRRSEVLVLS